MGTWGEGTQLEGSHRKPRGPGDEPHRPATGASGTKSQQQAEGVSCWGRGGKQGEAPEAMPPGDVIGHEVHSKPPHLMTATLPLTLVRAAAVQSRKPRLTDGETESWCSGTCLNHRA